MVVTTLAAPRYVYAADNNDPQAMYEQIQQLNNRLQQTELKLATLSRPAASGSNAFNPAVSLILAGTYGSFGQNPNIPVTGFAMSPNNHGYSRSFSLGESELGLSASIDPQFSGVATIALAPNLVHLLIQLTGCGKSNADIKIHSE